MVPAAWSRVYARRCCKAALNLCGAHFDSSYWFGVLLIVTVRHAPLRAPNKLKPVENVQKTVRKKTERMRRERRVASDREGAGVETTDRKKLTGRKSLVCDTSIGVINQRTRAHFKTARSSRTTPYRVSCESVCGVQYLCASGVGAEQSSLVTSRRRRRPSTWWPWTACTPGRCTSARSASRWSRPPAPCRRACG